MSTFSFQPSPAPGREGPAAPATQTGTAPAETPHPSGGSSPLGGSWQMILMMVLPVVLILMTMRGQGKKQKEIEASLKTGDTVLTQSGLVGKIVELSGTRAKVEIAPGVTVKMLKSAISGIDAGESKAGESKDSKDKLQDKKA